MAVTSLSEIEGIIKQAVSEALHGKVADEFVNDVVKHASSDVYGAYAPKIYERRGTLKDKGNYNVEDMGEMQIGITPVAAFNRAYGGWNYGDGLAGLINFGRGYNGYVMGRGASYVPLPRPYLNNTIDEWNGGKYTEQIRAALTAAGLKVR